MYLEFQKVQRELEHLSKLYIAYKFVTALVSYPILLKIFLIIELTFYQFPFYLIIPLTQCHLFPLFLCHLLECSILLWFIYYLYLIIHYLNFFSFTFLSFSFNAAIFCMRPFLQQTLFWSHIINLFYFFFYLLSISSFLFYRHLFFYPSMFSYFMNSFIFEVDYLILHSDFWINVFHFGLFSFISHSVH